MPDPLAEAMDVRGPAFLHLHTPPAHATNRCSASIELHPLLSLDRQDATPTPSAPSSYNAQAFMPEAFVISLCCAACDPVSHMVATSAASCCCFVHLRCRLALTQDQRLHRRSTTCPNLEDPVERQVPLSISQDFSKYHNDASSTSTVVSGNAKYPYARGYAKFLFDPCTTTVAEDLCNGTVKFIYETSTTTSLDDSNRSENARFEGITPRRRPR